MDWLCEKAIAFRPSRPHLARATRVARAKCGLEDALAAVLTPVGWPACGQTRAFRCGQHSAGWEAPPLRCACAAVAYDSYALFGCTTCAQHASPPPTTSRRVCTFHVRLGRARGRDENDAGRSVACAVRATFASWARLRRECRPCARANTPGGSGSAHASSWRPLGRGVRRWDGRHGGRRAAARRRLHARPPRQVAGSRPPSPLGATGIPRRAAALLCG
jgi:hypothetical protein